MPQNPVPNTLKKLKSQECQKCFLEKFKKLNQLNQGAYRPRSAVRCMDFLTVQRESIKRPSLQYTASVTNPQLTTQYRPNMAQQQQIPRVLKGVIFGDTNVLAHFNRVSFTNYN